MAKTSKPILRVNFAGVEFLTPFLPASGTFGYGFEPGDFKLLECFGGLTTKGISYKPRVGNPPPRVRETPCGLINSIGLENPGLRVFERDILPRLMELGKAIIVNLAGHDKEEFELMIDRLNRYGQIVAYEVNISCPNVSQGGVEFFREDRTLRDLLKSVKRTSQKINIVKIPPNVFGFERLLDLLMEEGFTYLTVANTYPALFVDIERLDFYFARRSGGLSGPAIYPITLNLAYQIKKRYPEVEMIASGGICSAEIAIQYFLVGASLVEIGSANFTDPAIVCKIKAGVENYLERKGFCSLDEIRGKLLLI